MIQPMNEYENSLNFLLPDQSATEALGIRLAGMASRGDIIFLCGTLGIGKSVLARAFIRTYCHTSEDIPSPTFTLVQTYDMEVIPVFHFDLYRLRAAVDVIELGIEEAFVNGISLIEWPDRLGDWLPANRLEIHMKPGINEISREVSLTRFGSWETRVNDSFRLRAKVV